MVEAMILNIRWYFEMSISYKLGLWGARADNSGLGNQTLEFFQHMKPYKTMVLDISPLEANPERLMKQYPERYDTDGLVDKDTPQMTVQLMQGIPDEGDIRQFLKDLDVVFIAESAYNMDFYRIARQMNVKTAVQYNYEFFDWYDGSIFAANPPDLFIAPSTWHFDEVQSWLEKKNEQRGTNMKHVYLHCPVATDKITRRNIDSAHRFVHIAGRPAEHDRNGTYTFLNAIELMPNDLRGLVYTQDKKLYHEIKAEFPSVEVKFNTPDYHELYKKGSVLVLPRKYGGNCLPMNEALAAGMPVIMSKVSPQADFLPNKWLINAPENTEVNFAPRGFRIGLHEVDPAELAMRMRWFKSLSNADMLEQSNIAYDLAQSISWAEMAPKYREVFEALCQL